jgi:Crinkler effector protein N-terminal domain
MSSDIVTLFCLLKDRPLDSSFKVNVCRDQSIYDLKNLIKEEMKPDLDHISAINLNLYQVSIPFKDDTALEEIYQQLERNKPLYPHKIIDEVFSSPAEKHIHVIVKAPDSLLLRSACSPHLLVSLSYLELQ